MGILPTRHLLLYLSGSQISLHPEKHETSELLGSATLAIMWSFLVVFEFCSILSLSLGAVLFHGLDRRDIPKSRVKSKISQ